MSKIGNRGHQGRLVVVRQDSHSTWEVLVCGENGGYAETAGLDYAEAIMVANNITKNSEHCAFGAPVEVENKPKPEIDIGKAIEKLIALQLEYEADIMRARSKAGLDPTLTTSAMLRAAAAMRLAAMNDRAKVADWLREEARAIQDKAIPRYAGLADDGEDLPPSWRIRNLS